MSATRNSTTEAIDQLRQAGNRRDKRLSDLGDKLAETHDLAVTTAGETGSNSDAITELVNQLEEVERTARRAESTASAAADNTGSGGVTMEQVYDLLEQVGIGLKVDATVEQTTNRSTTDYGIVAGVGVVAGFIFGLAASSLLVAILVAIGFAAVAYSLVGDDEHQVNTAGSEAELLLPERPTSTGTQPTNGNDAQRRRAFLAQLDQRQELVDMLRRLSAAEFLPKQDRQRMSYLADEVESKIDTLRQEVNA